MIAPWIREVTSNMKNKKSLVASGFGIGNQFKAQVIERRQNHPDYGKVVFETPWASNLILEQGMNAIPTNSLASLWTVCAIGTGTTATYESSGAITVTMSGTTATANTAIFQSTDVGSLLFVSQTQKATITGYTSSTQVTLAAAITASGSTFTIYRINQTGLTAEVKRSNTYLTGSPNCGAVWSGNVLTCTRTYDFSIETSNTNYNEVGFSNTLTSGSNLNMRGIFSGAPVAVLAQQQLRVIYNVILTVTPTTPRSKTASISGWPALSYAVVASASTNLITLTNYGFALNTQIFFQGTTAPGGLTFNTTYYLIPNDSDTFYVASSPSGSPITITSAGSGVLLFTNTNGSEQLITNDFSYVDDNGNTVGGILIEPIGAGSASIILCTQTTLPTWPSGSQPSGFAQVAATAATYVSGSYTITASGTFSTTTGNSNAITMIGIGSGSIYGVAFLFQTPQQKTNTYTLTLTFRWTWDRDFNNGG